MSSSNSSPSHFDPLLEAQRAPRIGQSQSLPSGPPDRDPTAIVDCPELLSLLCQDWTDADKETLLSTFNIVRCEPRSKGEYLPLKNAWGCEDAVAAEAWRRYFDGRTLKDRRIGKKVEVVEMKDGDWSHVVRENTLLIDGSTNAIFGFVMYDFIPAHPPSTLASGLLSYLNTTALKLGNMVRDVRRDDLGKMPQLGYTPGSRSAVPRILTWCRGLSRTTHTTGSLRQCIHEATSITALLWSASRAVLPQAIIDDFDAPTTTAGLPRMDWNSFGCPPAGAHVSAVIEARVYELTGLELGPLSAFAGQDYTRFTHSESNDNGYVVSLTTNRAVAEEQGRHFYYARYGVKVVNRTGALIVHRVGDAHGTMLPHRSPQEETAKGRAVEQNGLSLLLPRGIVRAWKSYQTR